MPGMCNRCLRKGNSGGLSRQNMTTQPLSVFFQPNAMSALLRLPLSADICNALWMVTHHWKDARPWVDVIASLISHHTSIWSSKHMFCLLTNVTNPLFNSDSWCLKSNSHEGWWGILSCIACCFLLPVNTLIGSAGLTKISRHTHKHTDNLLKHSHATTVNLVPSCRLDINCDFQTASQMPCRIPGVDVFHILKWLKS